MNHSYSIVVCTDNAGGIGKQGKGMLWNHKAEMHHFRNLTLFHSVVMGRRTWETLPKPLNLRQNIVLTRNRNYKLENALVVNDIEKLDNFPLLSNEVMVIGGLEIWKEMWDVIDTIYMSVLFDEYEDCDLFFPKVENDFDLVKEESQVEFTFYTYQRKTPSNN